MNATRDYYSYLEDESETDLLDDLEMALLLKESMQYKGQFAGKGESDLNKIARLYSTKEEWKARAGMIKKGILKGLGLDPLPKRTPLHPIIHGKQEFVDGTGKGYSVENVALEILPGFYATGNLYKPIPLDENELRPVVLTPHGHHQEGRFRVHYQKLPATLARMGCYAMSYDMQGYNEANQVEHKATHVGTFQTWQSMRVLDFMLSLPGADPKRVCCTGNSGGGTQTFLLTALDERVCMSIPVVMVSAVFYGGCSCESGLPIHSNTVDGASYATNNAEIAAIASVSPRGPRPLLLISIGHDWTALTPRREFPFIQDIYGFFGKDARELVENAHIRDEEHDYGPTKRQAAYKFIAKHFELSFDGMLDAKGDVDEGPSKELDPATLKCFTPSHPRPENALKGESAVLEILEELKQ